MNLRAPPCLAMAVACLVATACHAQPQAAGTGEPRVSIPATDASLSITQPLVMPTPRAAHSATLLSNGRVLLAGGCNADGCEEGIAGDAVLFDPATDAFTPAGNLHQPRVGHRALALADGSVLLFGGFTRDGVSAVVERYDPASGRFSAHGRMLEPRDGFSATRLADGPILLAGGYGDGMRRLASAERYDPTSGRSRQVGLMAAARMSHTATRLVDGRVLMAGGSRDRTQTVAEFEVFDPATERFSPAGTLARARHKHAAILVGSRVLVLGGAAIPEGDGHYDDSEWWSAEGVGPGPRMAAGRYKFLDALIALDDGRTLVAGGAVQPEILDAPATAFRAVDMPAGQRLAFSTATALQDGRVLIAGGYDPDIRLTAHAWLAGDDRLRGARRPKMD